MLSSESLKDVEKDSRLSKGGLDLLSRISSDSIYTKHDRSGERKTEFIPISPRRVHEKRVCDFFSIAILRIE